MARQHQKPRNLAPGGTYWLYGLHAVRQALQNPARECLRLCATRHAITEIEPLARHRSLAPETVEPQKLEAMLPADAVHQGLALQVRPLDSLQLEDIFALLGNEKKPILLLDQVTDPHNVGAILRSAAAFDVAAVVVTSHNAPRESAVLAKAASGALEMVPLVEVTNLSHAMETLKKHGYWLAGLDGAAQQTLQQAKLGKDTALVLGAEGAGLRRLTAERCDYLVKIPMSSRMESLNVSNAAAIALSLLYHA